MKKILFGKELDFANVPNLIEIQHNSYNWFLQADVKPSERKNQGLQFLFTSTFPIKSQDETVIIEFVKYSFGTPKYTELESKILGKTYAIPLKAKIRVIFKEPNEIREQDVFLADFPLMTKKGTFIINGIERVIVNQLHRSPGIFFSFDKSKRIYGCKIVPEKGSWLEFDIDEKNLINVRIDKKKKILLSTFLRALGYSTDEEILRLFYSSEEIKIDTDIIKLEEKLLGKRVIKSVIDNKTGALILSAGEKITSDLIKMFINYEIEKVEILNLDDYKGDLSLLKTIQADDVKTVEEALKKILFILRPGEPVIISNAKKEFPALFFTPERYDIGAVGRYKINKRFGFNKEIRHLSIEDIIETIKYLIKVYIQEEEVDDIDHLGNRRIRSVGELLVNALKPGFARMKRILQEKMQWEDVRIMTPQALIAMRAIASVINEFFGLSPLSQFMDQVNPLAELTHMRRLSALGPGGLTRERAGYEVRDIHYTQYGRICPIETPEGPNIGLILSLSTFAKINSYGFIVTPYIAVENGVVTNTIKYLTADEEENYKIGQAPVKIDENRRLIDKILPCRYKNNFIFAPKNEIQYIDVSPKQIFSLSATLIPFLEHDDANRALMGSNMQRQAVPLVLPELPLVATGMESIVAKYSGSVVIAENDCEVIDVDASKIVVKITENGSSKKETYELIKFDRTNQNTTFNQIPIVKVGEKIKKSQILTDGPAIKDSELALGRNLLVAFLPMEGYNFEDSIVISESVVREDKFTSIHIEEYVVEVRDTKLGPEIITRDLPNVPEEKLRELDKDGIVRIGAEVKGDDILVGKGTPRGEVELTPEYKLLYSIFGEKVKELRDTSLRLPHGGDGIVIDVKRFRREAGAELNPGVEELVKVYVAQKRKLQEGDKLAGRHGNKGVISKILPVEDMPYLEDGTPIEIILNPLGIPSRMNIGQLLETQLGWACKILGIRAITPVFEGATINDIVELSKKAGLPESGKVTLYDGKTGLPFKDKVMVGYIYMLKLIHLVEDKIHARSTGPYSLITQQPLGGKAQFGGQRLGEMEVWALEAYGAAHTLQEMLTVKSDDMMGRAKIYEALVKGENPSISGLPESFNVLVHELRGLGLDVSLLDKRGKPIEPKKTTD